MSIFTNLVLQDINFTRNLRIQKFYQSTYLWVGFQFWIIQDSYNKYLQVSPRKNGTRHQIIFKRAIFINFKINPS